MANLFPHLSYMDFPNTPLQIFSKVYIVHMLIQNEEKKRLRPYKDRTKKNLSEFKLANSLYLGQFYFISHTHKSVRVTILRAARSSLSTH